MKRIYLLLVLLVSFTAKSIAQTDMKLLNNVNAGAVIVADDDNPNAYIFSWAFINKGPNALTVSDTIKLRTPFRSSNPYRLNLLGIGGLAVNDTAYFRDTVSIVSNNATTSSNNTSYNWCDSMWVVNGSGVAIGDGDLNSNKVCSIITFAIWATNVNEADTKVQALRLFPNPATSVLNFKYNFGNNEKGNVVIRNIVGKTVYTKDLGNNISGEQQFSLDISNLSAGIYMVELNANGKKAVEKVTIQ